MKKFTMEEHIRKHTKKENTYNSECEYCNPAYRTEEIVKAMRYKGLLRSALD